MKKVLIVLAAFVLVVTSLARAEEGGMGKKSWKISGDLEEACKCNAACPCWFGSKPSHMNCGGQLVYFIKEGKYGDVSLDGLSFARMGQSPDGQKMMDAFGNWVFDYSYIDEKANPEQRKALEEISWALMPAASKNSMVKYVPITRVISGKEHKVMIGTVGSFAGQLMDSLLGGVPKIVNAPGADPIRAQFFQGLTTAFRYTDASQDWTTSGSNYMYTEFTTDSEEYAKFGTTMMHMMESQKKSHSEGMKKK